MYTERAATGAAWRATCKRLTAVLSAHPLPWLVLAAAAPFVPGALEFLHRGVPDILFTGDGATLELRTLHAAHGTQQLGPYSRFQWNHPGPAFFYLALPFYELCHERGPALNLFVFVANVACAIGLTLSARRLRGNVFAFFVAALLAVYECVSPQFPLSAEWNPASPILPLALVTFLGARLALGSVDVLAPFAFVASAIVQTHVGFVPVVASLSLLAVAVGLARKLARRRLASQFAFVRHDTTATPKHVAWSLAATACVLAIVWLPALVENATRRPGNLLLLYRFFTTPHAAEHSWRSVFEAVAPKLAFLPLVVAQLGGASPAPSFAVALGVGIAEVVALAAAFAVSLWRRDDVLAVLSSIALGEIVAAVAAVRAIRGEIHPYLLIWITIVGWVATTAIAAWILSAAARVLEPRAVSGGLGILAFVVLCYCVREQAHHAVVFRSRDEDAERLARGVHQYLASEHVHGPLIRIAGDQWPMAVGVIVYLFKHEVPIFVDNDWLFMMGPEFASLSPEHHPSLHIADRALYDSMRGRPDFRLVAAAGETYAFLTDPEYLRNHRVAERPVLVLTSGVVGDPARAVDGEIPADGTQWDSPLSVVLTSTASAIEVTVARAGVNGVFLTADGSDTYAVYCTSDEGESVQLGSVFAGVPVGMGTGLLFSDKLSSCRTVTVKPERGDGYYSVGEIGFLEPAR